MAKKNRQSLRIITDSAAFAVYDPVKLAHRQNDADDWWTLWDESLVEMNMGNLLLFKLGEDGEFIVHLVDQLPAREVVSGNLVVEGQSIYLCSGEDIISGGLDPQLLRGGCELPLSPGTYRVSITRDSSDIYVSIDQLNQPVGNGFTTIPRLLG